MKNINFIMSIIIVIMFFPSIVNAASSAKPNNDVNSSCGGISDSSICESKSGCSWGYNGMSKKHCYSNSAELEKKVEFCASTAVIWQIVGWVFLVVKILIPLLLIILGVLDFSKAVMASKDDEIKKAAKSLGMRAISAVIIFFIPTIVSIIMGIIVDFKDSGAKADYEVCKTCILNPSKCDTSKDVGKQ